MPQIKEKLLFIETAGFSMWPFLKGQEKLIVMRIPISDLRLGDLVLYRRDDKLVCHRLVKKSKDNGSYQIYSRGDVCFGPAELVNEQMFQGKVIGIIRGDKITILRGLRQGLINRISLFSLPLFNFIIRLCRRILLKIKCLVT